MANKTTTIHHFVALLLLLRLPLHLYVFAAAASCEEEDFLVREKRQQLPSSRDQVPAGTGRELTIDNLSSAGGTSSSSSKTDGNNNGGVSSSRRLGVDRGTAGIFGVGTTSDNDRRGEHVIMS